MYLVSGLQHNIADNNSDDDYDTYGVCLAIFHYVWLSICIVMGEKKTITESSVFFFQF